MALSCSYNMGIRYRIGEKVRIIKTAHLHAGKTGRIEKYDRSDDTYFVVFDEGRYCWVRANMISRCPTTEEEQEKPSIMQRLSLTARKAINKKLRTLIEAGWLNEDLTLTSFGRDRILDHYVMENQEALAKLAEEDIEDKK